MKILLKLSMKTMTILNEYSLQACITFQYVIILLYPPQQSYKEYTGFTLYVRPSVSPFMGVCIFNTSIDTKMKISG